MATDGQQQLGSGRFQEMLSEECNRRGYRQPVYSIASDRRGGRTAWSAAAEVNGQTFQARFWYDGQYVNNAKEDAAVVVLTAMGVWAPSSSEVPSNKSRSSGETKEATAPAN